MKKLIILVLMFLLFFVFGCDNKDKVKEIEDVEYAFQTSEKEYIDSVTMEEIKGITYQVVHFRDGTSLYFNSHLYIKDVRLRIIYMSHLNFNKEKIDSIKSSHPYRDTGILDYTLFKEYLKKENYDSISFTYYNTHIRIPALKCKFKETVYIIEPLKNITKIIDLKMPIIKYNILKKETNVKYAHKSISNPGISKIRKNTS